jgi:3-oxoacyl-[acyl-carrier protein] reductase
MRSMNLDIQGNTALISASSSGLGKASAKVLAENGVNVMLNGRDPERLADAEAEVKAAATGDVESCQGDITESEAITTLVSKTVDTFGQLDHLITSAGGPPRLHFTETTDEDWYNAFDLLAMSVIRLVHKSREYLQSDDGGTIVNIASVATKEPIPSNILSGSIRAAVVALMKALATDLAPAIRVNAVLPGLFDTSRRSDSGDPGLHTQSDVPLRRLGDAMELGEATAFLCSDRSSYITGTAFSVDGGVMNSI